MPDLHAIVKRVADWVRRRARYRGSFLLILGVTQVSYGIGLLIAAHETGHLAWWPASSHTVLALPMLFWGVVWVSIGTFLTATFWWRRDRFQFALAVTLNLLWSAAAIYRGITVPHDESAWAPGAIYLGITVGLVLIAAWPDPPEIVHPPADLPLPPVGE